MAAERADEAAAAGERTPGDNVDGTDASTATSEVAGDDATEGAQGQRGAGYREAVAHLTIEWIKSIVVACILFLFIRTFVVEAFRIPSGSMEDTLLVGDFLLVNKAVFGARVPFSQAHLPAFSQPERGDIIVFVPPHARDQIYVKRLIGAPGDTVEMRNKALFVNGERESEPYVRHLDVPDTYSPSMDWQCAYRPIDLEGTNCRPSRDNWGPVVVPAGRFLMLGDNRDNSEDSRYWGFVDRSAFKGKPLVVYYSFEPDSRRRMPWFSSIRWSRIGTRPH